MIQIVFVTTFMLFTSQLYSACYVKQDCEQPIIENYMEITSEIEKAYSTLISTQNEWISQTAKTTAQLVQNVELLETIVALEIVNLESLDSVGMAIENDKYNTATQTHLNITREELK